MAKSRKEYSAELRAEAVKRYRAGERAGSIAKALGIAHLNQVYAWARKSLAKPTKKKPTKHVFMDFASNEAEPTMPTSGRCVVVACDPKDIKAVVAQLW